MGAATTIEKQEFFMTVEKVEAIAGNLTAWLQAPENKEPSDKITPKPA